MAAVFLHRLVLQLLYLMCSSFQVFSRRAKIVVLLSKDFLDFLGVERKTFFLITLWN